MMHIPARFCLLICCCMGLAACTAGESSGPDTTVTTPSVGRPAPPSSAQAALSREAFTPYAALGQSNDDGLAPGESSFALTQSCLAAAGYPNVSTADVPFAIQAGPANLSFSQPWGAWGYLGVAQAEQSGFLPQPGSALSALGIDVPAPSPTPPNFPAAERAAIGKCATIVQNFTNAVGRGPLAGIQTLSNDIYNDILRDAAIVNARKAWTACMARNGYSYSDPIDVWRQQMQDIFGGHGGGIRITVGQTISTAANQAQIAAAVADANCTQSTDLAGIYFAVQASYEQQLVNANQQALGAAVQRYRADYAAEVRKLPALLKTAKAVPFGKLARAGGPARVQSSPCAC